MVRILKYTPRILLAVIRNCGVAIAISIFFAAAGGPSKLRPPSALDTLAALAAKYLESSPATPKASGCEQPIVRVCRLVDAEPRLADRAP